VTDVLEVLLELEYLQADLVRHPLEGVSEKQFTELVVMLHVIMDMITRSIISKDCSAHLEQISSGAMT